MFTLFRREPITALLSSRSLLQGKAAFEAEIARQVYNQPLLNHLCAEHAAGRDIYLATAANEKQARGIADYLGIVAGVFASRENVSFRRSAKLDALQRQFSERGFDYVGNAGPDIPVLAHANTGMLANPSPSLAARLKSQQIKIHRIFGDRAPWFKSFSLVASTAYILNDMLDVEADRNHPKKRNWPFAAGDLTPQTGIATMCILVAVEAALAWKLPPQFAFWLGAYFVTTVAYSLLLKKVALLDVLTLAGLYTVRLIASGAASQVLLSTWLGGFSIFFFLSLAMVKRYAELYSLRRAGYMPANERGYFLEDMEQLRSFGTASGYACIVVFTLYINNPEISHLYANAHRLWMLIPMLILWISRIWLLAHRGKLDEDPVVFALTDRLSPAFGLVALLIVRGAV